MTKQVKMFLAAVVVLLILAGGFVSIFWYDSRPVITTPQPTQRFVVTPGQSTTAIANNLAAANLIREPLLFRLEVKRQGLDGQIQAGSFDLAPSMTLSEIVQNMTSGTQDAWITIPEGWRREEIADSLAANTELEAFDKEDFLSLTATSEGRLFPDTYLVPREATAQTIVNLLQRTFTQKVEDGLAAEIAKSDMSFEDIIILASLLEREARTYEQMRLVSGILQRRMELGMPLQVDATLQYARGYSPTGDTWWPTPTSVDRQRTGPYNTYSNPGLPPGPISNPGLNAFRAALNPQRTNYVFYIHDNNGEIHPAVTLDEHNANIERYLR